MTSTKDVHEWNTAYTETGSVSCVLKRPPGHVVSTVVLAGAGLDSRLHVRLSFDSLTEARKAYRLGCKVLAARRHHARRFVTSAFIEMTKCADPSKMRIVIKINR